MNHPRYKAYIYLKGLVNNQEGLSGIPCLTTRASLDKEAILNYCKALLAQDFIVGYRMMFSPTGDENSWYFDSEVSWPPDTGTFFWGMP